MEKKVMITRMNGVKEQEVEIIDGSTQVLPQGISNGAYKDCGNLMRSWMDVYYMEEKTPFYTKKPVAIAKNMWYIIANRVDM